MLCDDIIRLSQQRARRRHPEAAYAARFKTLIEDAERFVLDREAIDVILNVEESKPTALLAGRALCRMPFPVMWIEYDLLYRLKQQRNYGYPAEWPSDSRHIEGGLLLVATDETRQRGVIYSASRGDSAAENQRGIILNPISYLFDWTAPGENTLLPKTRNKYTLEFGDNDRIEIYPPTPQFTDNDYVRRLVKAPQEQAALAEIEQSYAYTMSPEAGRLMALYKAKARSDEDFTDVIRTCCFDWSGEKRWLLGLMLLLNTRNLVEVETRSVRQQNHGRSPRALPALLSHKVIKIKFSRVAENRAKAQGVGEATMRWHKVRGHWKVRKTGVFFWHDHHRGDMTKGAIHHEYRVTR